MIKLGAWIKRMGALFAALVVLAAVPLDVLAAREALVKRSSITVRASASAKAKVLFRLKKGETVTVTRVRGNVAQISYKGKTGYLPKAALSLIAQAQTIEKKDATSEKTQKLMQNAIVYASASKSAAKKGRLSAGSQVTVIETRGSWTKIRRGSDTGFVLKSAFTAPAQSPTPAPTPAPTPQPAKSTQTLSTTAASRLYAKASQSAPSKKVAAGAKVEIYDEKGNWYKVRLSGVNGFMLKKAFAKPEATAQPTKQASPFKALKTGASGADVLKLQKRLEGLGYLDVAPTGKYASSTAAAVKLFQAASGLKKTGAADANTQAALYAQNAKTSDILSITLRQGAAGSNVKRLQSRLKAKKYYAGKASGKFDAATKSAVMSFQAAARLNQDGVAGPQTLRSLFSANAPLAGSVKATPTPQPTPVPQPTATPKPAATAKPATSAKAEKANKVIAAATAKLGRPYILGSAGPNSYDCSGLTRYAYKTVGITLPHSAYLVGYNYGRKVSQSSLQRGDIVCFNTVADSDLSDHVGIYIGGGSFIHASSGQGKVVISSLSGYYARTFSWGRSVL
jgi:cell wall-associated NlpC family hydrolase